MRYTRQKRSGKLFLIQPQDFTKSPQHNGVGRFRVARLHGEIERVYRRAAEFAFYSAGYSLSPVTTGMGRISCEEYRTMPSFFKYGI